VDRRFCEEKSLVRVEGGWLGDLID